MKCLLKLVNKLSLLVLVIHAEQNAAKNALIILSKKFNDNIININENDIIDEYIIDN